MESQMKNTTIDESMFINEQLDDSDSDSESEFESDGESVSNYDTDSDSDSDSDDENDEYFSDDNMVYKVNHLENVEWMKGYNSDGDIYEINEDSEESS